MLDAANYTPRLKTQYRDTIRAALKEEFGYKNDMQIPRLDKIVLNIGCGAEGRSRQQEGQVGPGRPDRHRRPEGRRDQGEEVDRRLPRPRGHAARRQGHLRGERMYEFLDRLITIAMPRVRDFRGVSGKAFDGRGNYAMGMKEHIVFPEINFDKVDEVWGMDIIICTTAETDAEAKALLKHFNMPFNS